MNFTVSLLLVLLIGFFAVIAQVLTSKRDIKTDSGDDNNSAITTKVDFDIITPRSEEMGSTDYYNTLPDIQKTDKDISGKQ